MTSEVKLPFKIKVKATGTVTPQKPEEKKED